MKVKLLTEHRFEFLSLKGGCTVSSESKLVKIPHCWKSHVAALHYLDLPCNISLCSSGRRSSSLLYDWSISRWYLCSLLCWSLDWGWGRGRTAVKFRFWSVIEKSNELAQDVGTYLEGQDEPAYFLHAHQSLPCLYIQTHRANSVSEFVVANTLAKWKKL